MVAEVCLLVPDSIFDVEAVYRLADLASAATPAQSIRNRVAEGMAE
jgi:hypothetical protein